MEGEEIISLTHSDGERVDSVRLRPVVLVSNAYDRRDSAISERFLVHEVPEGYYDATIPEGYNDAVYDYVEPTPEQYRDSNELKIEWQVDEEESPGPKDLDVE